MNTNRKLPEFAGGHNPPPDNCYPVHNGNHPNNYMYNQMPTFNQVDRTYSPNSSFSTDSFYSQSARPKKKIFELSGPPEPNMMMNAHPIKYHNHVNSQPVFPPTQYPFQYDSRDVQMPNYQNFPQNQYENLRNPPQQFFQGPPNRSMQYQTQEPFSNPGNYNPQVNQHLRIVSDMHGNPMQNMNRTPPRQRPNYEEGYGIKPSTPSGQSNRNNYHGHEFSNPNIKMQPQSNKSIPESLSNLNLSGNQGVNGVDFDAMSLYSATSSKRRTAPIVILNINVGNGVTEELKLFDGEDPAEVARNFCIKYKLTPAIHPVLTKNLNVQAEKFYELRAQKKQQRMLQNQTMRSQNNLDEQASMYSERAPQQRVQTEPDYQDNHDALNTSFKSNKQPLSQQQRSTRRNDGMQTERNASKSPVTLYVNPTLKKSEKENPSKSFNKSYYEEKDQDEEQMSEIRTGPRTPKNEVFEKLYQQGMKTKHKKESASRDIQQQMTEEELREATFHPKINQYPKYLQNNRQGNVEEDFIRDAEYKQKRRERAQLLKEILELEGMTAQAQIATTPTNKKLTTPRTDRTKSPIHNKLYEEAAKKKDKESILKKPKQQNLEIKVNPPSTSRPQRNKQENQKNKIHESLYQEGLRKSKSISKLTEERSVSPIDPKTKQPLFKPKINKDNPYYKNVAKNNRDSTFVVRQLEVDEDEFRQVQTTRNSRGIKLHDFDDSKSVDRSRSTKSQKATPQTKNETIKNNHSTTFGGNDVKENTNPFILNEIASNNESRDHNTSVGSVNIHKHNKLFETEDDKLILMKIFQSLDSNRDGRITAQDVDYSNLDAEVLEVIKDIIFSLEDDVVMSFEGFVKEVYENNLMSELRELKELFQIESSQPREPFLVS